jgi:hypothetical protein
LRFEEAEKKNAERIEDKDLEKHYGIKLWSLIAFIRSIIT